MPCRERVTWCGLVVLLGCVPVGSPLVETSGGGAGSSGEASSTGTGGVVVTTGITEPGSSGSSEAASSSSGNSEGGQWPGSPTDGPADGLECDPVAQDCPPGEKCTWYAANGGSSWNASKCMPVMEGPAGVGEECFVVGNGVSGIDNCDATSYCWDTNAENMGYCVAFCTGSVEAPKCMPGYVCTGYLYFCFKGCDPLSQDCEDDSDVCIPVYGGFLCVLDASGEDGQAHDPCEFANACDAGLLCADTTAAIECDPAASGCCEPFCDLTMPNTCPGAGQVCNPYYEDGTALPGYENVGYCAVPQ